MDMDFRRTLKKRRPKQLVPVRVSAASTVMVGQSERLLCKNAVRKIAGDGLSQCRENSSSTNLTDAFPWTLQTKKSFKEYTKRVSARAKKGSCSRSWKVLLKISRSMSLHGTLAANSYFNTQRGGF